MIRSLAAACLFFSLSALAAAEPPAPAPPQDNTAALGAEYLKLRDPFKKPVSALPQKILTELEQFAVEQYKLLGVMMGGGKVRAMLQGPNGKNYFVSQGEKIGTQNGVVRKITADSLYVRERIVNVFGQEEPSESVIHLLDTKRDSSSQPQASAAGGSSRMGE